MALLQAFLLLVGRQTTMPPEDAQSDEILAQSAAGLDIEADLGWFSPGKWRV